MSGLNAPIILPAIDVRDGRVVRLKQGDYAQETVYGDDPQAMARCFADNGARWLHLVDLDAARGGGYTLEPLLRQIDVGTELRIQTGGGVRSRDDVATLLRAGAARVVIGSLAVQQPKMVIAWLDEFGTEAITIALDTRRDAAGCWRLPIRGWTAEAGQELFPLAERFAKAGLRHLLCTDIARDGMLSGPNIELYRELSSAFPQLEIQASGGMRSEADAHAALAAGCRGVVLGRALLEGAIDLSRLLSAVAAGGAPPC